jgi:hypothetical protein
MSEEEIVDEFGEDACPVCGSYMETESCWSCFGEGGHHDCGEDCCCCLVPEINVRCDECNGRGCYQVCSNIEGHAALDQASKTSTEQ